MARLLRWSALIIGLLLVLMVTAVFIGLAVAMGPFGGVPYSWDLLVLNRYWIAMLAAGLLLVAGAARMFVRARGGHSD